MQTYADYVLQSWTPLLNPGGTWTYTTQAAQDVTANVEANNYRQWWFQTCTELAYWQNAPETGRYARWLRLGARHRAGCRRNSRPALTPGG